MRSNRERGNGLKRKHRKFCTDVHKNFCRVRVTEHRNRLPRGIVVSSSGDVEDNKKFCRTQEG